MAGKDQSLSVRHDERNLARLNLVLAPNRTELYEWSKDIQLDSLGLIRVTCTAPRNSQVPHGLDNDILLGLVSAAVVQGLPADDTVRLSIRELLRLSGIDASARAYKNLKESLYRLQHTAYNIVDSWYDGKQHRWRTLSFSLIVKHWSEDNSIDIEQVGQWRAQTLIAIKLDDGLMANIRAGHIRPLDLELLSKLTQPLTRTLFRTLSFQRETGDSGKQPVMAYSVPLSIWATHLGLYGMRNDTILRALAPAHEELKEAGFLSDVTYQGRGKDRYVHYTFRSRETLSANPQAVALLVQYGISGGRALGLAQTYRLEAVRMAVSRFDALLQSEYRHRIRNRPGILTDILENPEKYDTILATQPEGQATKPHQERPHSEAPVEQPSKAAGECSPHHLAGSI